VPDAGTAQSVSDRLLACFREMRGAGLSAPQIGINLRVFIVEVRKTDTFPDRPESPLYTVINPEVIQLDGPVEEGWEGCFSIPNLMGRVPRFHSITLRYTTREGATREETFEGYLARVFQHEHDHLDGVLFVDRMTSMESLTTEDVYRRYHTPGAT
jgi:peptide deformylase